MTPQELRMARRRFGLSQRQLAALLHCQTPTYSKWESGKMPISAEVYVRIASTFALLMRSPWTVNKKVPCSHCAGAGLIPAVYNRNGQLVPAMPMEKPRRARKISV